MCLSGAPDWLSFIVKIKSTHSGSTLRTLSRSHSQVPLEKKSETVQFAISSVGGPIGLTASIRENQLSSKIFTDLPSLMDQPSFCDKRFRPTKMFLQPCETEDDIGTSIKDWYLAYFPSKILAASEFGFMKSLQASFAWRDSLNSLHFAKA